MAIGGEEAGPLLSSVCNGQRQARLVTVESVYQLDIGFGTEVHA